MFLKFMTLPIRSNAALSLRARIRACPGLDPGSGVSAPAIQWWRSTGSRIESGMTVAESGMTAAESGMTAAESGMTTREAGMPVCAFVLAMIYEEFTS